MDTNNRVFSNVIDLYRVHWVCIGNDEEDALVASYESHYDNSLYSHYHIKIKVDTRPSISYIVRINYIQLHVHLSNLLPGRKAKSPMSESTRRMPYHD